jgi:hypothetical protein
MKKIASILILVVAALCLAACVSYANPKALSALPKLAIAGLQSNSEISWYGDDDSKKGGLVSGVANLMSNSGKKVDDTTAAFLERADGLVAEAEATLASKLSAARGSGFVPPAVILPSDPYKTAKETKIIGLSLLKPDGYRFVDASDKALPVRLKRELGVDGVLYATFGFQKRMWAGVGKNGSMTSYVTLQVVGVDGAGKMVFNKFYSYTGKARLAVVADIYDPLKLKESFSESIASVCDLFVSDLMK